MGKKKNSDFSKIKVKIGKSKPSNNATKFNIKTAKVVIPGDKANKAVNQKEDQSFKSIEKGDLLNSLSQIDLVISEYLSKKKVIMQSQHLDLTQSVWPTYYRHQWVTPWDNVVSECNQKMGPYDFWFVAIVDAAAKCSEKSVNEKMVVTVNLYLQLHGETARGIQTCRRFLEIIKMYIISVQRYKRLLAVKLLSLLAQHCPFSLWFHARQRASIFALETLQNLFDETKKTYEPLLDDGQYLLLSDAVINSALNGRRAGSVVIGEDWSQIDDIINPPFKDLIYRIDETLIDWEIRKVTDSKDKWDESVLKKQSSFNLEGCLSTLAENVLGIGLKLLPVDTESKPLLEKLERVLEVLNRCCLRSLKSKRWDEFVESLMKHFPYKYDAKTTAGDAGDEMDVEEEMAQATPTYKLSKKLELAKNMKELCKQASTVKDPETVHRLNDAINYQCVALVHQCVISERIDISADSPYSQWLARVKLMMDNTDLITQNQLSVKWLTLAKQMMTLTFDRQCQSALPLCEVYASVCRRVFLDAHDKSKPKRLSLAVLVEYCIGDINLVATPRDDTTTTLPPVAMIDQSLIETLVHLILTQHDSADHIGFVCTHPTYVSSQTHVDITLSKSLYLLVSLYPDVGQMIAQMDTATINTVKNICHTIRRKIGSAQYPVPQRKWNTCRSEQLQHVPGTYYWDHFTSDNISRKDAPVTPMKPIGAAVAPFLCK